MLRFSYSCTFSLAVGSWVATNSTSVETRRPQSAPLSRMAFIHSGLGSGVTRSLVSACKLTICNRFGDYCSVSAGA